MRSGSDVSGASSTSRLRAALPAIAAAGLLVRQASAAGGPDASYGRAVGDVTLVAGAGVVAAAQGPRAEAELRLRYLETAGVFASYEDGPLLGSAAEPLRVFAAGLEVRPLFLGRWLDGHETSGARLDLLVDSIGIELGAAFQQPSGGAFSSRPAAQVGLAIELPIFASATGPWIGLHGGMRWSDAALAGSSTGGPDDRSPYLAVTAAWHQVVLVHAVDVGDRPPD
jgi:hypothetical protein